MLRLISSGIVCPNTYPHHIFISCVDSLERLGLVKGLWNEGHELEDVRITKYGKIYLATNPNLRNPIDNYHHRSSKCHIRRYGLVCGLLDKIRIIPLI